MVPKFRAFDTKNKVMVTNFHRSHMKIETGKVLYQLTTTNENEIKAIASYNTFDDFIYRYSHDLKLMQSTGLKDKNGVEVFQGDIVKCTSGCPHEVVWLKEYAGMYVGGMPAWYLSGLNEGYAWIGKEEVMGNIFENPELLEQANE